MRRQILFALAIGIAGPVAAQEGTRPDPRDPSVPAPQVAYRSAFEDYRPFDEADLIPWRAANEQMARLGGHQGHTSKPSQKSAAKPATPSGDKPHHGGHK